MLVKKFEAGSMKEALELVKNHLGPDAIILAAKDNNKGFGLVGKNSVEVTAAVSEIQFKKKQVAESRLREEEKEKLKAASARSQKKFIQKSIGRFEKQEATFQEVPVPAQPAKPRRYIDIEDEGEAGSWTPQIAKQNFTETVQSKAEYESALSRKRVREAAQSAFTTAKQTFSDVTASPTNPVVSKRQDTQEIMALKTEVQQLRSLLQNMKSQPQTTINLHPGADVGISYELSFLYSKLIDAGLSKDHVYSICKNAAKELSAEQIKKKSLVDAWAVKYMMNQITLSSDSYAQGLHLFVGGSGHGKTSALVKMASHLVLKEKKSIAILTTDTRRVGAVEQLKIYSQILNVPFSVIRTKEDWQSKIQQTRQLHAVLVDFPGLALRQLDEIDLIQSLMPPTDQKKHVHLVQSVNQKDIDAYELARRYRLLNPTDVIFTKLDESAHHGLIYNFNRDTQLPLHSFGIGPMIPEDYEVATKERVIDLIFKISKLKNN